MPAYSGIKYLLHDHADGAFSLRTIMHQLHRRNGISIPRGIDIADELKKKFNDPHSNIVATFGHVTSLLQTLDNLYLLAKNHVLIRSRQGFIYDEFMIAPQYHLFGELSKDAETNYSDAILKVIDALVCGIKDGEKNNPGIKARLLVGIGREVRSGKAIKILKAIEQSDRYYTVGFNLVCDESRFPPQRHRKTFEYAASAEINSDCHASEWVRRSNQSPDFERDLPKLMRNLRVVFTELLAPPGRKRYHKIRAGHCIALPYDDEMMKFALDNDIGITGCPGSNVWGKNVPDIASLRIRTMLDRGILWTMNPDDDFFHPDVNETFQAWCESEKLESSERKHYADLINENALKIRFGL